jgi:multiple sugar transport system substrate-binding protein
MINRNILITLILGIVVASHCTRETPILTFAVGGAPHEVEYWETLIQTFQDSTGIAVKVMRQPTDTDQRRQGLVIPLKAHKKDPDVFLMDVVWVAQFAASGWLFPLDVHKEKNFDQRNFFTRIIEQVDTYNDTLIALPVYNDCGLLYYRKDLLEKYNCTVPETWQELVAISQKIQPSERLNNPQFYGFVWQGAQYEGLVCTFLEFAVAHGGELTAEKKPVVVDRVKTIAALQFMTDLIHTYKISPPNTYTEMKEEEVRLFFEIGNAVFERNWPYAWGLHRRDDSPLQGKVGVSILPKQSGGHHAATLGGWHIGISKFSDKKDEALRLVKFIVSYDIQKRLALDLGWNPGRSDIYDDDDVKKHMHHITILKEAFEHAVARPHLPYYTQISEVLQRYLNAALSARLTPADALTKAQQEIDQVAKTYHE